MRTCIGEHGEPVAKRMRLAGVGAVLLLVAGTTLGAQDWPHFLGPERDGHYSGPPLDRDWPGGAPRELWRRPVGEGFAGPVVSGGRLLLFHRLRDREVLEALDAETGDSIWRYDYPSNYRDDFGFDEGPRSAPVVAGDRVYTFGAQGQLHAVDLETGNGVWRVDTRDRFRFRKAFFGAAGSPLVEGGRVIANVGGPNAGIVAFDADSGEVLWTVAGEEASYSSPVAATFDGVRHALFFTRDNFVSLDPASGRERFRRSWRARIRASVNAATPLVTDDLVFVSAQYGTGAGLFRVAGSGLDELWRSNDVMSNHYATSVHRDGYLYGYPRAAGVRAEPARRGSRNGRGRLGRAAIRRRQRVAGRRCARRHARVGRADACRRLPRGVHAGRSRAPVARHRAGLSGAGRRPVVRTERRHAARGQPRPMRHGRKPRRGRPAAIIRRQPCWSCSSWLAS